MYMYVYIQGCIQDFFSGEGGGDCIHLQSKISDINLARLMRITLASVDFDVFEEKN